MRGINKVNIAIESFVNDKNENCSVAYKDFDTRSKYLITNSKLKYSVEYDSDLPLLYIAPIIVDVGNLCAGVINLSVRKGSFDDPLKLFNIGFFVYEEDMMLMTESKNNFRNYFLNGFEDMMKELIVKWSEENQ